MLLDIISTPNKVINDQLTLKSVDVCFVNTLQILCKLLLSFAKLDIQTSPKFGL